ncbi:MAG: DUF2846 domain-containing protein [Acidobacteriota bacterium]|jgi:hypothetical protein|nr:DUF2846 domain-containing protein [Acidobacteriota bacterium]
MKNTALSALVLIMAAQLSAFGQETPKGPKVFIESVPYIQGKYSGASIVSAPEIANRFSIICRACGVTIKKDQADYVVVFATEQSGEGAQWVWTVYENKDGMLLENGKTIVFNNSIKDAVNVIKKHWTKDGAHSFLGDSESKSAVVVIYRDAGVMNGQYASPTIQIDGTDLVQLSNKKYLAIDIAPGPHTLTFTSLGVLYDLDFNATDGKESYIKYSRGFDGPRLKTVSVEDAKDEMRKFKPENKKNILVPNMVSARKPSASKR